MNRKVLAILALLCLPGQARAGYYKYGPTGPTHRYSPPTTYHSPAKAPVTQNRTSAPPPPAIPMPANKVKLKALQGAWWSSFDNPTADFAITGKKVWLDSDSQYHPCKVKKDVLIFDLGDRLVKNRIISLEGDKLTLENVESKTRTTLTREKPELK